MPKGIKIEITNFHGDSRSVYVENTLQAKAFVKLYPEKLFKTQRVKIKCDALGVEAWVSGKTL